MCGLRLQEAQAGAHDRPSPCSSPGKRATVSRIEAANQRHQRGALLSGTEGRDGLARGWTAYRTA